jgi:hypothetical protein
MQILWMMRLLLLLLITVTMTVATDEADVDVDLQGQVEEEVLYETIAAGRGERDDKGVRDQWSSSEHLGETSKYNAKRPISAKVQKLLREYRLECDGCDHDEGVARINAFVLDTKNHAQARALNQKWLERAVLLVTVVALGTVVFLYTRGSISMSTITNRLGSSSAGGSGGGLVDNQRRAEIEEQRRRAAMKEEESQRAAVVANANAPTWRDHEEKEVWTPEQEKQFAKALNAFGGIPPKARYPLIADKVDDKTRLECLMHHKLQQLIAKEQ